jgi:hypothetical protein
MAKLNVQPPKLLIQKIAQEKGLTKGQFMGGLIATGRVRSWNTALRLWDGDTNTSVSNIYVCAEVLGVKPGELLGC